jgi:hypothetical protein
VLDFTAKIYKHFFYHVKTISYHHLVEYGGSRAGRRQVEGRGCLLQGRHTHILTHVIHVVCPGHLTHKKSYKKESCTFLILLPAKINATLNASSLSQRSYISRSYREIRTAKIGVQSNLTCWNRIGSFRRVLLS